jgi:hypothetical protein
MQTVDVDALLDRHRDRSRKLLEAILSEESGEDPFRYPLDRFRKLNSDEKADLVRRADRIARDRVDHELEASGASWLVLVGDTIVRKAADPLAIPSAEEVLKLGEPKGLVAFLFEAARIEEVPGSSAPWAVLDGQDRCPTIPLCIGAGSPLSVNVVGDLDTGSHATLIDADLVPEASITWFSGKHLGHAFYWSPDRIEVEIATASGQRVRKPFPVRVVRDWATSPFVRVNPKRKVLVGRDFLRAFALSVVLRTGDAETDIVAGE